MIPKKLVILVSGGLDSVTLLQMMHDEGHIIHVVMFDYGQPHSEHELQWAKYHCHRLGVNFTKVDLIALGGLTPGNWIVPNRNAIMLNIGVNIAIQAEAESVLIGCNKTDEANFPDCRRAFIQMLNNTLTTAEIQVEVCAPFLDWSKGKIARLACDLGIRVHEIWTCYQPTETGPCGKCPACEKLAEAIAT